MVGLIRYKTQREVRSLGFKKHFEYWAKESLVVSGRWSDSTRGSPAEELHEEQNLS